MCNIHCNVGNRWIYPLQSHPPGLCLLICTLGGSFLFSALRADICPYEPTLYQTHTYDPAANCSFAGGGDGHSRSGCCRILVTTCQLLPLERLLANFEHLKGAHGPRFKSGTSFDQVTALYDFDRNLRRIVMRGCEHVEAALRGSWAHQLALVGDGHSFLDPSHYKARDAFYKSLGKLAGEVGYSRETYIKHYRDTYDVPAVPPVWMVAEMISFGQLSRWYSGLADRSLRNAIARPLGLPEAVLVPFVRHITDIRNICAHHGRLWN